MICLCGQGCMINVALCVLMSHRLRLPLAWRLGKTFSSKCLKRLGPNNNRHPDHSHDRNLTPFHGKENHFREGTNTILRSPYSLIKARKNDHSNALTMRYGSSQQLKSIAGKIAFGPNAGKYVTKIRSGFGHFEEIPLAKGKRCLRST